MAMIIAFVAGAVVGAAVALIAVAGLKRLLNYAGSE